MVPAHRLPSFGVNAKEVSALSLNVGFAYVLKASFNPPELIVGNRCQNPLRHATATYKYCGVVAGLGRQIGLWR